MTSLDQRKILVKTQHAYLPNGLRCTFAGYANSYCGVISKLPGSYECTWETALDVVQRPARRFKRTELMQGNSPWGGLPISAEDFQTVTAVRPSLRGFYD